MFRTLLTRSASRVRPRFTPRSKRPRKLAAQEPESLIAFIAPLCVCSMALMLRSGKFGASHDVTEDGCCSVVSSTLTVSALQPKPHLNLDSCSWLASIRATSFQVRFLDVLSGTGPSAKVSSFESRCDFALSCRWSRTIMFHHAKSDIDRITGVRGQWEGLTDCQSSPAGVASSHVSGVFLASDRPCFVMRQLLLARCSRSHCVGLSESRKRTLHHSSRLRDIRVTRRCVNFINRERSRRGTYDGAKCFIRRSLHRLGSSQLFLLS